MSWLLVALIAYFLLAGSAVLDKAILTRPIKSPLLYTIYIGLTMAYAPLALLFFFSVDKFAGRWDLVLWVLVSGFLNTASLAAFYVAVKKSDVSRAAPFVAVFTAVFIFIIGSISGIEKLDAFQVLIFLILVGGALFLIRSRVLFTGVLAAFLLSASIIMLKAVYQEAEFLPAFLTARTGDFLVGLALAAIFGKKLGLRENWRSMSGQTVGWISALKIVVGSGLLVQHYAIFLGSAILVQALSGIQYFFVWLIVVAASKFWNHLPREKFPLGTIAVLVGLSLLAFSQRPLAVTPGVQQWGATFSKPWAERLGLDWRASYKALMEDLGVKNIRLPVYWNETEKSDDVYDFSDLDWQVSEAGKRGSKIIMVIGRRVPRWPECHIPAWLENSNLKIQNSKLLEHLEVIVRRYKDNPVIQYWQVENEPFLEEFGVCPEPDPELLDKEVALVRSLDDRKIVITDSGELGFWVKSAKRGDIFGTTMYGVIWRSEFPSGYIRYPKMPTFFWSKANLVGTFAGSKDFIVSELQAEPWGPAMIYDLTVDEQRKSMNLKQFRKNIDLAKRVGFREAYLWGAEWWYREKLEGRDGIWNEARELFANSALLSL